MAKLVYQTDASHEETALTKRGSYPDEDYSGRERYTDKYRFDQAPLEAESLTPPFVPKRATNLKDAKNDPVFKKGKTKVVRVKTKLS